MRVISGGQTGVDRAALDAALALGIECGGWCPKGRRAEDGAIPSRYPLEETDASDYRTRTRRNVEAADGTLILLTGRLKGGTALTREIANALGRPVRVVDLDHPESVTALAGWIRDNGIRVLNVAGPRESQRPGISARSRSFMNALLEAMVAHRGRTR